MPLSDFASRLTAALSKIGSTFLLEADPDFTPWTRLCIRQADRLLLVAQAEKSPEIDKAGADIERLCIRKEITRKELVLLHQDQVERPAGTKKWLDTVSAEDTHHHIRSGSQADYDRLVRLLTGHAVGVVLGGGGARGLAHIGVLRAFVESGVPIDAIGGTSMGSVIAGQYALGFNYQEMLEINKRGWIDQDPFRDKTLPIISVLACRKLDKVLDMMFGNTQIEDLWLKFFCVSADLTQAQMNVHTEGPLARAVRSSVAIPGVAVPIYENGNIIVDGGVLNNLPGDVMGKLCGGDVIAVDVSAQKDLSVDTRCLRAPSPWRVLWSRINPLASPIDAPSILSIMMRTIMMGSMHNSKAIAKTADLYIRPPVDRYGMFDWRALDKLVDIGYQFGLAKIYAWQNSKQITSAKE